MQRKLRKNVYWFAVLGLEAKRSALQIHSNAKGGSESGIEMDCCVRRSLYRWTPPCALILAQ